jgi:predicted secreted protein
MLEAGVHLSILISAFAVIWFLALFCLLPMGMGGPIDPETGAPLEPMLKKKMLWATGIAAVVWAVFYAFIGFGWLEL